MPTSRHTGKLFGNTPIAGGWRLLQMRQPALAASVRPGQRLILASADAQLEAYVSHSQADWLAVLAAPTDTAAARLPLQKEITLEGPLGAGWTNTATTAPAVVLAEGRGIGAALYLAERLEPAPRLVLLGSGGLPLPFRPRPSVYVIGGLPPPVIAAAPVLEQRGIPSRIADPDGRPGCFEGSVAELLELWLASHPTESLDVYACLPADTLTALPQLPSLRVHMPE